MLYPSAQQIYDWLDQAAPFCSAEDFDNVGLLLGRPDAIVKKVLFALDAIPDTVEAAAAYCADLMIVHHPLIFRPLRRIDYSAPLGQAVATLAGKGIGLLAAHTNWDRAEGGINDALAKKLELTGITAPDAFMRLGQLPRSMTAQELHRYLADKLETDSKIYFTADSPIRTVAVSGGSYGEGAVIAAKCGADAFIVGEIGHHDLLDVLGQKLTVFQAGHAATERPGVEALYNLFTAHCRAQGWQTEAQLYIPAPYPGALL